MGLRTYVANLPAQPLPTRRRFVVVATAASFVLIVLAWLGVGLLTRQTSRPAAPAATPPSAPGEPDQGAPAVPGSTSPAPLNLDEISASLLKAFGEPTSQR